MAGRAHISQKYLNSQEQDAWRSFIDGAQRLLAVLNQSLIEDASITLSDYRILVILAESPNGATRMSALAEGVMSSRSGVSRQVGRLEAAGLVERVAAARDLRGVIAKITPLGSKRLEDAAPLHVKHVRQYFVGTLTTTEMGLVADIFARVGAKLTTVDEL